MNEFRKSLIRRAFDILDKDKDGVIEKSDISQIYKCDKNPKVINGEWTEDECLMEFIKSFSRNKSFEGLNKCTLEYSEFENYYAGVSASIDSDIYFDLMMRNSWKFL